MKKINKWKADSSKRLLEQTSARANQNKQTKPQKEREYANKQNGERKGGSSYRVEIYKEDINIQIFKIYYE